ncbi:hypothetical protein BR93DRAFT_811810 [Coniochaeta sp. PMI_546]|nr:hypothetical protein BR93DRAFT_811810 [Coniochaeta sp. PMI_546]
MYKDMALSGGGASTYAAGPPVALYDLIGQKEVPVSYAYSCDMSAVGEEEEEEREDDTVPSYHTAVSPSPPIGAYGSDEAGDSHGSKTRDETPDQARREGAWGDSRLSHPFQAETRPQITQRETFPQTAKRPNWQTIRYQTMPGRAHKVQLEAWVSGWSNAVWELWDETYCACADSTAAPDGRPSPPATMSRDSSYPKGRGDDSTSTNTGTAETERGRQKGDATAAPTSEPRPDVVASVCRNCSRQPSPNIPPDQEFVLPPTSGVAKMALMCKLAWRRILDRTGSRQSPDRQGRGPDSDMPATTPISQAGGHGGYDEEDDEDGEVDVDKLSRSSKDGHVRRAGDDIEERQARLRRAQRLLRKEGRNMREDG